MTITGRLLVSNRAQSRLESEKYHDYIRHCDAVLEGEDFTTISRCSLELVEVWGNKLERKQKCAQIFRPDSGPYRLLFLSLATDLETPHSHELSSCTCINIKTSSQDTLCCIRGYRRYQWLVPFFTTDILFFVLFPSTRTASPHAYCPAFLPLLPSSSRFSQAMFVYCAVPPHI